jgi:hypothetical protein
MAEVDRGPRRDDKGRDFLDTGEEWYAWRRASQLTRMTCRRVLRIPASPPTITYGLAVRGTGLGSLKCGIILKCSHS